MSTIRLSWFFFFWERVFKKAKPDVVIHLAAASRPEMPWEDMLKVNIIGTRNIYECCRKYKVKKVIFTSSNRVTGAYEGFPKKLHKQKNPKKIKSSDPVAPDSEYGTCKAFGEIIARQYFEMYKINSICLRLGSVMADDHPKGDARRMKAWLSYRDLVQLIEKSIKTKIKFGIYYGISRNKGRFFDISNTMKDLGYKPKDDSSKL